MTDDQILDEFRAANALLEGHFILSSGLRSPRYLQCARVLMVEDVVTTGLSSREAIAAVREAGGDVIAEAALVDRSGGTVDLGVPFVPLIRIDVPTYDAESLPPELASIPAIKPGSRAAA
jgi:orotate phosphoribosyltransferase